MCNGCPVKKTIVNLPTRMKGNLKCTSGNSLCLSGARTRISQTLLTKLKLHLRRRLHIKMPPISFKCRSFLICISFVNSKLIIFLVVFYLFHRIA